jgi:hypothetical protein
MAKKPVEETRLALAPETALSISEERPTDLIAGDTRGTEDMTRDDMQMPRLAIAQQMSPELQEDQPQYIDGLKMGEMFNSVTKEIIGKGPVLVAIVRRDPPRWVEFVPRDQGGGVKDPNVPMNDPRTQFGPNGEQPVATKFYDYVLMRVDKSDFEMVGLSLKSTGLKVARNWNTLIKMRNAPLFRGVYRIEVVKQENAKGKFFNFSVNNAGWTNGEATARAEAAFEAMKDRVVVMDREHPDDTSFETTGM